MSNIRDEDYDAARAALIDNLRHLRENADIAENAFRNATDQWQDGLKTAVLALEEQGVDRAMVREVLNDHIADAEVTFYWNGSHITPAFWEPSTC